MKKEWSCVIREGRADDAGRILSYIRKMAGESDFITFSPDEFCMSMEEERAFIEECANSRNHLFLIAEVEGEIAGNLVFRGGKYSRTAHAGEFGISVLKKYWGCSIGRSLLQYLIDWAKKSHVVRKINLRVRVDNERAIRLYERMGFAIEGRLKRDFYIGGKWFDSYLMGMSIDPDDGCAELKELK
ncbi:GNAT family N-acetyltransferase [Thermoactinomyces sp. CICC 10521]|uniref:GNAT family N-acetyltransferase n=1 Tax=Thermoactinomyces sp. CICC 10521 TaxID=2767426 RepID=UPI0018DB1AA8|nr:GNAT family N-acetyltransferase [Thermoactinomyces sp. CICC 10521]